MTGVSPYTLVKSVFQFPENVEDREFQIRYINEQAPLPRSGLYWDVGAGKTLAFTCLALYKKLTSQSRLPVVVLVPPILTRQWRYWLESIIDRRTGRHVTALEYKGTPRFRKQLNPHDYDFVVMSLGVFKRDFEHLSSMYEHLPMYLGVDEATAIKNTATDNHRKVRDFATGRDLTLLTGTPLSKPIDAYAYVKLISPTVYRSLRHFEALHVAERDFFGNVTKWSNLDMLRENLMLNSSRVLKEEVQPYLKKPMYIPLRYQLDPTHAALYKRLAEEQILLLEDGGKIDATSESRLYNMLQQIICNPGHFSGDPNMRSAAHEILDQTLDELSADDLEHGEKLIVFCLYNMTNAGLGEYLKPYNAVQCYGKVSMARQIENIERFKHDPECRVAVLHPISAGQGTDGLQKACSNAIFIETPIQPKDFKQGTGRLYRDGQKDMARIVLPIAEGTIQVRLHERCLQSDKLLNTVQGGFKNLREAIYGEEAQAA